MENDKSNPEMQRFTEGLRKVLSVSKSDLRKMLDEEKRTKVGKSKPGPKSKGSSSSSVPA
jgi:hypothetical protein